MVTDAPALIHEPRWRIAQVRLTVFLADLVDVPGGAIFERFFGFSPEIETKRKAELHSEFSSLKGTLQYTVQVTGPRVQIDVTETIEAYSAPSETPQSSEIELFDNAVAEAVPWLLEQLPSINRVAVGYIRLLPTESRETGYRVLSKLLPAVNLDPSESSDFMFRINRPRSLDFGERSVKINRLCTWSCLLVSVTVNGLGVATTLPPRLSARLESDINTVPEFDFQTLNLQEKLAVFSCIFAFSRELPTTGDIQ
ncbi:MAG: hypothetical protein JWL90_3221 [Chthoniobacteraceae bacterium]|nr:hypothetical protein [Chthoniobacteraceae bacterium]